MGKAGYPKNWPDSGVFGRQIIKIILKIFELPKTDNVLLSKIEFRREAPYKERAGETKGRSPQICTERQCVT